MNLLWLLVLGLLIGLVEWPYQALSELDFALQRALWSLPGMGTVQDTSSWDGVAFVFAATVACLAMAWGPLAASRGGGVAQLPAPPLAQLAAVGATALFAGANGTPIFCAVFVFTLQGDPQLLLVLLLVSAVS